MMTIVNLTIVITRLYLSVMNLKEKFGHKIKQLREQKEYSIEYLANIADIDRTYISDIEKGKRNVSLLIIEKLSKALEVKIQELFDYEE
jgi:transcriptional regulator with XRE-family HTH domain